jgi:hypothetical protein
LQLEHHVAGLEQTPITTLELELCSRLVGRATRRCQSVGDSTGERKDLGESTTAPSSSSANPQTTFKSGAIVQLSDRATIRQALQGLDACGLNQIP